MGDITKKTESKKEKKSLEEKAAERELRKQETVRSDNKTIENLAGRKDRKNKAISARVNGSTYVNFKKICEARGITANACLNMIITDFVRENKAIIEK